jgi:hypothetical protein
MKNLVQLWAVACYSQYLSCCLIDRYCGYKPFWILLEKILEFVGDYCSLLAGFCKNYGKKNHFGD